MAQIEKIKKEIERRMLEDYNSSDAQKDEIAQGVCAGILTFINSLPQEEVSEDLEKELNNQMDSIYPLPEEDDFDDPCYSVSNATKNQRIGFEKGFKVGANWQREQMLKDAIPCTVLLYAGCLMLDCTWEEQNNALKKMRANSGDKVKLIIIKED